MLPRLTPPSAIPASLEPLKASAEYDDLEAELKAAFIEVFEAMLRPGLQRLNSYGVPHLGTFPTVERFVKADGLAMERRTSAEVFMAELYRAWRARNPRRGTAFLRYYLQLLWPGQWELVQQWQDGAQPYPKSLHTTWAPGRFLTSRLRLSLALEDDDTGVLVGKLSGSFRAVLPARLLLDVMLTAPPANTFARAANWADDCEWEDFEGVAAVDDTPPPPTATLTLTAPSPGTGTVGAAAGGGTISNGGAVSQNFTLSANLGASVSPASGSVGAGASVGYTITPVAAGAHSITLANTSGGPVAGSPASFTATTAPIQLFSNVVFQMPAEGPNGGTAELVDVSSYGRTINRFNSAAITTAHSAGGGSSLDCTGAKFATVPSAAELNLGSAGQPFTIQGFLRLSTFGIASSRGIVCKGNNAAPQFLLYIGSANPQRLVGAVWDSSGTQTNVLASADHLVLDAFKHFAMTWDGSTLRVFYDGAMVSSAAFTGSVRGGTEPLDLGNLYSGNNYSSTYLNALLDDISINNGQCLYTGAFTPPTPPFPVNPVADYTKVVLRLPLDSDFTNVSNYTLTTSVVGGAAIVTSGQKYGAGAATFDGNGDRVLYTGSQLIFGTNPVVIDLWVKFAGEATGQQRGIIGNSVAATYWFIGKNTLNQLFFTNYGGAPIVAPSAMTAGVWTHVRASRQSGVWRLYIDGVMLAGSTSDSTNYTANVIIVGSYSESAADSFNGQIDDVRVSVNEVIPHGNFTPPAGPLPTS